MTAIIMLEEVQREDERIDIVFDCLFRFGNEIFGGVWVGWGGV